MEGRYARADETFVQLLEKSKVRISKQACMWVFTTGRAIVYQFALSREGQVATEFLKGFQGHLQADGYSGYNALAATPGVIRVGCWAHARRKFVAIAKTTRSPGVSHYAVAKI